MLAPGSHALNADVAGCRIRLGGEVLHVVGVESLAGDGVGVEERLVAAGGLAGAVAGEVLVIDETQMCCWRG
jgi:hypothetical protein